jgi:hypothetical protein
MAIEWVLIGVLAAVRGYFGVIAIELSLTLSVHETGMLLAITLSRSELRLREK